MAKYILLSLTGDNAKVLNGEKELRDAASEIGYYGPSLVEKIIDGGDDWTEYVFSVDEAYPFPMDLSGATIYDAIASWCVNVAFGKMEDYDSQATLEDVASQLDKFGNKGDEFRRAAEEDFWRGTAKNLDEMAFQSGYEYMPDDIDPNNEDAVDAWVAADEEYNFDEWYREQKKPFDIMPKDEVRRLVYDIMYGMADTDRSWWK